MYRQAAQACAVLALFGSAVAAAVVPEVRSKLSANDLSSAEAIAEDYCRANGKNSEYAAAISWLARGSLMMGNLDAAARYLAQTNSLVTELAKSKHIEDDSFLEAATGAAIEVQGQLLDRQRGRDKAVAFLTSEREKYKGTTLERRIQKRLNLLTLEGKPAPELDRAYLGKPVLLFLWAHWCGDCKAQVPALAELKQKYGPRGLKVLAPTRRYGSVPKNEHPTPEQEDQEIERVWSTVYAPLGDTAHPISEAMMVRYGVSSTPTLVLVDRKGIVQLYRPTRMTEEELGKRIEALLDSK